MTSLNPILQCGKQIAESLMLHWGMKKKEAMEEAIHMMQAVGIADFEVRAREYPHQMSGGDAPAGDDRHGAGLPAQDPDCG